MATHKKTPLFVRIITKENLVVCINPTQLSSFQIIEKAKIQVTGAKGSKEPADYIEADTIRFYFPTSMGLSYSVGVDITQEDFNYICSTLLEYLYLNEAEFKAKSAVIAKAQMDEWNKISEENQNKSEVKIDSVTPAPAEA